MHHWTELQGRKFCHDPKPGMLVGKGEIKILDCRLIGEPLSKSANVVREILFDRDYVLGWLESHLGELISGDWKEITGLISEARKRSKEQGTK